jgi:hypothetical protein
MQIPTLTPLCTSDLAPPHTRTYHCRAPTHTPPSNADRNPWCSSIYEIRRRQFDGSWRWWFDNGFRSWNPNPNGVGSSTDVLPVYPDHLRVPWWQSTSLRCVIAVKIRSIPQIDQWGTPLSVSIRCIGRTSFSPMDPTLRCSSLKLTWIIPLNDV